MKSNHPPEHTNPAQQTPGKAPHLIVTGKSWRKDSFGLFDHESKDVSKHQLHIKSTSK